MTRTKTTKLVAIVMAVFMAFTFFCFSVVTTVRAEDGEDETSSTSSSTSSTTSSTSSTEAEKTAPTPDIALTTYTYGAPDINVTIDFKDATPKLDYSKTTDTELLKTMTENIKVYSDKELTKQVNYTGAKFSNLKFENNKVTFTVPLNKSARLSTRRLRSKAPTLSSSSRLTSRPPALVPRREPLTVPSPPETPPLEHGPQTRTTRAIFRSGSASLLSLL